MTPARGEEMVAIVGAGRNGSTLLARLLDGSPDLWIHPVDVTFLPAWDDLASLGVVRWVSLGTARTNTLQHLEPLERRRVVAFFAEQLDLLDEELRGRVRTPLEIRRGAFEGLLGEGRVAISEFVPAFLAAFREAVARRPGESPRLLGFKTSETAYIDDYLRLWPELRFVHIVRDPVANYRSMKRTWIKKGSPFWTRGVDVLRLFLDDRWLPHARAIRKYRDADPQRHVVVRYEDLVADPESVIFDICERLGIRPPVEPTVQTFVGGEQLLELPPNSSGANVETPAEVVPDMATRFSYTEVLSDREEQLIRRVTAELAQELGYEDQVVPQGKLGLWLRWLPVDASERENATHFGRLVLEVAKRRLYVTRMILSS